MLVGVGQVTEDGVCAGCGEEMKVGAGVFIWQAKPFCSEGCLVAAIAAHEEEGGIDFVAAHDQALAAVQATIDTKPRNFVLLWSDGLEDGSQIGCSLFGHPEFVAACVPMLMDAMLSSEPNVAPPE